MAVANGNEPFSAAALAVSNDANREFVCSPFTRLEVLPMAQRAQNAAELSLYAAYFAKAAEYPLIESVLTLAIDECRTHFTGAIDALHVATAAHARVDEFVTTERETKPINRTTLVKVISLSP